MGVPRSLVGARTEKNPRGVVPTSFVLNYHPKRYCRPGEFGFHLTPESLYTKRLNCHVVFETSDRLMLYKTEPSKQTRCCFGHSCHDPEPKRPMKNMFSIPRLTAWRTCKKHPMRNTCQVYDFFSMNGRGPNGITIFHLQLLLLLLLFSHVFSVFGL